MVSPRVTNNLNDGLKPPSFHEAPASSARRRDEEHSPRTISEVSIELQENYAARGLPDSSNNGNAPLYPKTEEQAAEEEDRVYPPTYRVIIITTALVLATLVVALDMFVIATAIPKITSQFHFLDDIGWYGSAYQLTNLSLQPLLGKLYSRYNIKRTFLAAVVIFEVGSVVIATAQASHIIILGRAIAGVGASGIFAGALTIIAYIVPLAKRPLYIASITSVFGIAAVAGPLLGGVLTDRLSWRWCFWINLPIGGITIAAVLLFFREPERTFPQMTIRQQIRNLDPLGAALLLACVTSLLLALGWGGSEYDWSDSRVWGTLLSFGLLLVVSILWQWRQGRNATIPGYILRHRSVWSSCLAIMFIAIGQSTFIYYLPIWFQAIEGASAEQSGIRTTPLLLANTVMAVISGGLVTYFGWYLPFMWIGTALFAVGAGMLTRLEPNPPLRIWLGYQIIAGFGIGMSVQVPFMAVQVVLPEADVAIGSALVVFSNSLGEALAVSTAENIFVSSLQRFLKERLPNVDPEVVIHAGAAAANDVVPVDERHTFIQTYSDAITTAFVLAIVGACAAFVVSLFVEWKTVKDERRKETVTNQK